MLWSGAIHAKGNDNVAYQDRQVRFTVITDGVIRLEWEPKGRFEDLPSFVASERNYPDTDYKVSETKSHVTITTSKMVLSYKKGSGKFTAENLTIDAADKMFTWKPGMKQQANLKGTFRTLDGLDGDEISVDWLVDGKMGQKREMEDGILARDGWTLIDESENFLFDDSEWAWVKERKTKECQDWYFMAYGQDYKAALKDFTIFAGKMPLPPRFAFGYWWSRYWCYSDSELRSLVSKLKAYDIPLDVLVVDMDWHYTDYVRGGWTGWTWNKSIFPDPERFMKDMKEEGLKITLNLHPADGFDAYEECYADLAKSLGKDPTSKERIEWVNSDKKFMSAMFDKVMHPMQEQGVDFWWLDWQQYLYDKAIPTLTNTWWINYCYFSDMQRYGEKRPMLYHRWGGLGNHRYQIGFSGDTKITWKSLDFQPYFTSTSSNVLYGYWSHDLGGHMGGSIDQEMYTRWLQFGCFSPIMRTHSTKDRMLNKEPWVFDEQYTDIIRRTVHQRYELVPYIYTMARKAYDEGLALCRPLYYDYPSENEAYEFRNEYMFGDDILIAPITKPATDGYTEVEVWLPEGDWYEMSTGTLLTGGKVVTRYFALDEYGIYMKAGSVLPFHADKVENLDSNDEAIAVTVFPGGNGTFSLYEDAGNNKNYSTDFATTAISNTWNGKTQKITISPRVGSYAGMPQKRDFKVKVLASEAPVSVKVNSKEVGFEYLRENLAFVIEIPETDCSVEKVIEISYDKEEPFLANGFVGYSRRVGRTIEALKFRNNATHIDRLAMMGTVNDAIRYNPEKAAELVDDFFENYHKLPEVLAEQPHMKEDAQWFIQECGWNRHK